MTHKTWAVLFMALSLGWSCVTGPRKPVHVLGDQGLTDTEEIQQEAAETARERQVHWVQKSLEGDLMVGAGGEERKAGLSMNFEDIDLVKFIDVMMTEVFKENYLITEDVQKLKQKFSIKMTQDLPRSRAFGLFRKIVNLYSVDIRKEQNVFVFEKAKAPSLELRGPFLYGRSVPEGVVLDHSDEVTFLIPFYSIAANKLAPVIGKYLSPQSTMVPVEDMNLLLIHGRMGELEQVLTLVNLLDRSQFKDQSILMLTPRYWGIVDFADKVGELLAAEGVGIKKDAQSQGLMFVPIENLNSLMVISPVKEWAERVLYWLDQLDVPEAAGESRKVFHYKLRNVEVGSVEEVLKSYLESNPITPAGQPVVARPAQAGGGQPKAATAPARTTRTQTEAPATAAVMAIKETNSLVIIATPAEYQHLLNIIRRVDSIRNQVFVEVMIGEITLEKTSELGLEFWMNHYLNKLEYGTKGGLGVSQTDASGATVLGSGSNMTIRGVLPGLQYELLLNALVRDEIINIISTPKVMVLENEEAEISVGADIPVIAAMSGYGAGTTTGQTDQTQQTGYGSYIYPYQSINYVNTGIILKVKPAILSNNNISLKISQEISEAQTNETSEITSPEILKRKVDTTLVVQEGQIAFMGGLIQKKQSEGETGIPLLSKIPLLGNLFKKKSKTHRKTELVLFINAKIIQKMSDMRSIVEGVRKIINQDLYVEEKNEKKK